eukprot:TRINITY_DN1208_c0_g1_i5.p3 TRINITY_DN1208_c0_g1~~TRINITY_DN1208_c0_g1_i5.p3  ORF type:complete len:170 (+),score=59.17 TRINITY_DN1208_c0_g1_i5:64-573(+)
MCIRDRYQRRVHGIIINQILKIQNINKKKAMENLAKQNSDLDSQLCKKCHQFYGNQISDYLCSSCYKEKLNENKTVKAPQQEMEKLIKTSNQKEEKKPEVNTQEKQKTACSLCKKKVGYLGFQCKCDELFCNLHRQPEKHNCKFDFKNFEKQKLKQNLIQVKGEKLEQM